MGADRLNFTSQEVLTSRKEEKELAKTLTRDIEQKFFKQISAEDDFLSNYKWSCPPSVKEDILLNFKDHEFEVLKENENDIFLGEKDLKALACVAKDITFFEEPGYRNGSRMIKEFFRDVRLIGIPSADGYAMSAYFKGMPVVLKAPRVIEEYTDASVKHELVVGKILNSLRPYIHNFSFTLSSFMCGPPVILPPVERRSKSSGDIIGMCMGGEQVRYIMQEKITNVVSFNDYCKNCSVEQYIAAIIQVMFALNVAFRETGFTHCDLHGENALFRKIEKEEFYLPFGGDFLFAEGIVSIIDYGRAYIKDPRNGESYGYKAQNGPRGNVRMIKSGMYIDHSHPVGDCYRILNSSLYYMKQVNKSVYNTVKGLLNYFYDEEQDLDEIVDNRDLGHIPSHGSPSYLKKVKKFRYEYFIMYCREFCANNDIPDPVVSGKDFDDELDDFVVLPGSNGSIITLSSSKDHLDSMDRIEDYFDYIETLSKYNKYIEDNNSNFGGDIKTSNHRRISGKMIDELTKRDLAPLFLEEQNKLLEKIRSVEMIDYKKINSSDMKYLKNRENLRKYMDMIEITVMYLELMDEIESKIEMLTYMCTKVFESTCVDLQNIVEEFKKIDERKIFYNFIYQDILVFSNYLDNRRELDVYDEKFEQIVDSLYAVIPADFFD